MGNREDDRNLGNPMRSRGAPDRSARPDERSARPEHRFDHYVHGPNESPYDGGYPSDGFERGSGFLREDRFGHTPGQRWSGGYGGDRDRYQGGQVGSPSSNLGGSGFTGSDFGGLPQDRDRHFGNAVDRGGRVVPTRYGFQGTDMGMGARELDRGPHYGKGPKGYKRSDERTRDDACDAIAHFGHVDASDVEVKVADGIVTLSGTVANRRDKRALEHVVEVCLGVEDVHNELRVKRDGNHENGKTART